MSCNHAKEWKAFQNFEYSTKNHLINIRQVCVPLVSKEKNAVNLNIFSTYDSADTSINAQEKLKQLAEL